MAIEKIGAAKAPEAVVPGRFQDSVIIHWFYRTSRGL